MTLPWFQLMRAQRIRGRTALTVPFFIGASRPSLVPITVPPEAARAELHALLRSFLEDCPVDHAVSIYQCADVGDQPVAIEFFSLYSPTDAIGLRSESQSRTNLYLAPELSSRSLADLTERFFTDLHSHICNAEFSYILGEYRHFTPDDREFIEFSRTL